MSDYVLFQMWEPHRQSLINAHKFYLDQARKRLLSQFENIEAEADTAAKEWLDQRSHLFDPDRHDPGDFYEGANDAGIEFYELLSGMREQTRLSVVAGMYHGWDKQLRDWLVREVQHWHNGEQAASKIWSADFDRLIELLESLNWNVRGGGYFHTLDACRLVVNTYKHGEGTSFERLKSEYPTYVDDPFSDSGIHAPGLSFSDHTHLRVTDDHIDEFSEAIIGFWEAVPKDVFQSQVTVVPKWFEKAILTDRGKSKRAGSS